MNEEIVKRFLSIGETEKWKDLTEVQETLTDQKKCTRQPAAAATMNAKYHSSQPKADQYTAETASRRTRNSKASQFLNFLFYFLNKF